MNGLSQILLVIVFVGFIISLICLSMNQPDEPDEPDEQNNQRYNQAEQELIAQGWEITGIDTIEIELGMISPNSVSSFSSSERSRLQFLQRELQLQKQQTILNENVLELEDIV